SMVALLIAIRNAPFRMIPPPRFIRHRRRFGSVTFMCNPQGWLCRPEGRTCRCLWQMQAGEGPMRHRVHAACAAMNDNAEL
ncbi:MAG: hypothetical protein IKM05_04000, partial [Clostridia bacterium]|nr:hypothetical protein [Clostridia bacterium]